LDDETKKFKKIGSFDHPYPTTKIMWSPEKSPSQDKDRMATTGDYLRVWNVSKDANSSYGQGVQMSCLLNNVSFVDNCIRS
jgi:WD repeat-containing protein 68